MAVAGHIDHGKTALVKALTGIDADRLPEEKRRGITVDLGFAYLRSSSGEPIGFVDVPGHERLVRTMVAGATGVEFAILVVAADDGVMPQTREHLAILDLLGLRSGLVALTKIDRVDGDRVARVRQEVNALLADSGLAGAPTVAVSTVRGDGIGELIARLDGAAAATRRSDAGGGYFRLSIDRAFTLPGIGLVVTGSARSGRVGVGDRLVIGPGGREVRVRGLRVNDARAPQGAAGQRCALNITGARVDKETVTRGAWLLDAAVARPTVCADVRLRLLPSERNALRHWTPVHVHIGAADLSGRVALLEGTHLAPGERAFARIVLDEPTVTLNGDRFVLRDQSAQRTLGGGWILDPDPPARNARKPERLAVLTALDTADAGAALDALLEVSPGGVDRDRFALARNLRPEDLDALVTPRSLVEIRGPSGAPLLFSDIAWQRARERVIGALEAYSLDTPDGFGAAKSELVRATPPPLRAAASAALDALVAEGAVVRAGQLLRLPGHAVTLSTAEETRWIALRAFLDAAALDPPRVALLAEQANTSEDEIKPILHKLARMGRLVRVSKAYVVLPSVVTALARAAERCVADHPDAILTVGRFREATGIGRHATMPMLEFFDRIGLTRRHRDGRRLRSDAASILASLD